MLEINVKGADTADMNLRNRMTFSTRDMDLIGTDVWAGILTNTKAGLDYQGNGFEDYTTGYAETRSKWGLQTSPVNLNFTGKMLDDIVIEPNVSKLSVVVAIRDTTSARIALAHINGSFPVPSRQFFGVTKEARKEIIQTVRKALGF